MATLTIPKGFRVTPEQFEQLASAESLARMELTSPSDLKNQRYADLQLKMEEYLENGVKLGWLIDPSAKTVEIYRFGQPVEILNHPQTLSGEDILLGFFLDLTEIW